MKRALSTGVFFFLLMAAGSAQAWWGGTPYNGYWPHAWPSPTIQRGYSPYAVQPYGHAGNGWNMRGYMTQQGDVNFVMEYRGNINQDFFGGGYGGYPGYGTYQQSPYYGWR